MKKLWCEKKHLTGFGKKAFSLVEVVLAVATFALFTTVFAGTYLYGQESTILAGNRTKAVFLAEEAVEVVRSLRDESFDNLAVGTHGLVLQNNTWTLSGTSDTTDIFTRTVVITETAEEQKEVTVDVSWQQNARRTGSVTLNSLLTNWRRNASGMVCVDQAAVAVLDVTVAELTGGNKTLQSILLNNSDPNCSVVVSAVNLSWVNANGELIRIRFNNSQVWSGTAIVGTEVDIADTTINNSDGTVDLEFRFDSKMKGETFSLEIIFSDETSLTANNITP